MNSDPQLSAKYATVITIFYYILLPSRIKMKFSTQLSIIISCLNLPENNSRISKRKNAHSGDSTQEKRTFLLSHAHNYQSKNSYNRATYLCQYVTLCKEKKGGFIIFCFDSIWAILQNLENCPKSAIIDQFFSKQSILDEKVKQISKNSSNLSLAASRFF